MQAYLVLLHSLEAVEKVHYTVLSCYITSISLPGLMLYFGVKTLKTKGIIQLESPWWDATASKICSVNVCCVNAPWIYTIVTIALVCLSVSVHVCVCACVCVCVCMCVHTYMYVAQTRSHNISSRLLNVTCNINQMSSKHTHWLE